MIYRRLKESDVWHSRECAHVRKFINAPERYIERDVSAVRVAFWRLGWGGEMCDQCKAIQRREKT